MELEQYCAIGKAIVRLMDPLVEVVIHDLSTGKISFIEGSLSKRQIGDPSYLETNELENEFAFAESSYIKHSFDGRLVQSISVPIKQADKTIAVMCINYDTTPFQELTILANKLLKTPLTKKPTAFFKNDWQERIHEFIHTVLKEQNLQFHALTNKNKKEIILRLYEQGAFAEKNAADYIAKIMDTSRATVFNYLRSYKKENHAS